MSQPDTHSQDRSVPAALDASPDTSHKLSRKRWNSREVNLLLLACVHHRKQYHKNATQGLMSVEDALKSTLKMPAAKIRIKIKNIRSSSGRAALSELDLALLNAFLDNVEDKDLPSFYWSEIKSKLPVLDDKSNLSNFDDQESKTSESLETQSEDETPHSKVPDQGHVLAPTLGSEARSHQIPHGIFGITSNAHLLYNSIQPNIFSRAQIPGLSNDFYYTIIARLDQQSHTIHCLIAAIDRLSSLVEKHDRI